MNIKKYQSSPPPTTRSHSSCVMPFIVKETVGGCGVGWGLLFPEIGATGKIISFVAIWGKLKTSPSSHFPQQLSYHERGSAGAQGPWEWGSGGGVRGIEICFISNKNPCDC